MLNETSQSHEPMHNPQGPDQALDARTAQGPIASSAAQSLSVRYDPTHALPLYSNSFLVTGTPEEVILDFGLNPTQFSVTTEPVKVNQKVVVNYFTAKRLLAVLQMVVQRLETCFGVIEPDVSKRKKGAS